MTTKRALFSAALGHLISITSLITILKVHEHFYPDKEAWNIMFFSLFSSLLAELAFIINFNRFYHLKKILKASGLILKSWCLGILVFLLLDFFIKNPILWIFPKIAFTASVGVLFFDLKNKKFNPTD